MNIKITLLLIIALLSVSNSPIVAKALTGVSAVSISFWRMLIASSLLWLYSIFSKQGKIKNKKNFPRIIIAGILLGVHFVLFFGSIKLTSIANATFLGTTAPIFTIIFEIVILKRIFNRAVILGLIMTFSGALIIVGFDFNFNLDSTIGNLMALACSFCLGIAFIISEKIRDAESTVVYTRTLYLIAAITIFIIGIINENSFFDSSLFEYLGLFYLGIVPTIIGHNSIYYAIKYVSPTVVAAFPVGEPIIATVLAYFIFSESINFYTGIGGIITILGLFIISLKKKIK